MPYEGDSIAEEFPHPSIPPILGVPTYTTIAELHLQLNANAASVYSSLGDGAHGLLPLTISLEVYNTLSAVPFVPPVNPGAQPDIPAGATGSQIAAITREHNENHCIWREYLVTNKALKQQLLAAVNATYYRTLRNRITGFATITTRQLLEHLYRTYGNITPADLIDNDARMKSTYDPSMPIEVLFNQIEDAVELADAAKAAYTVPQVVNIAYNCIFQTGLFTNACRDWRRQPIDLKTWPLFKTNFALAHQELCKSQVTTQGAGYNSANLAITELHQDTTTALANLASATISDCTTVSQLSSTNSLLTTQLADANAKLTSALATITKLNQELKTLKGTSTNANSALKTTMVRKYFNTNYCWTHGYHIHDSHTSQSCKYPKDSHKCEATRANTMGGSNKHKDLCM